MVAGKNSYVLTIFCTNRKLGTDGFEMKGHSQCYICCHKLLQVLGGLVVIIGLPLVASPTQSASYVFTHFEMSPESTGVSSKPYAVILSVLLSNYCLYGYDTAAHLTEETKGADRTGPIAILSSIGIITVFGWAYNLALTFSIKVNTRFL